MLVGHPVGAGEVHEKSLVLRPATSLVAALKPRQIIRSERLLPRRVEFRVKLGVILIERVIGFLKFLSKTINRIEIIVCVVACRTRQSGDAGQNQERRRRQNQSDHSYPNAVISNRSLDYG